MKVTAGACTSAALATEAEMARVEARLWEINREIKRKGALPAYDVTVRKVGSYTVAAVRDVIPTYQGVHPLLEQERYRSCSCSAACRDRPRWPMSRASGVRYTLVSSPSSRTAYDNGKGVKNDAELGHLRVPENRHDPHSRTIELAFVRFRSTADHPGPPLVFLAGREGPASMRPEVRPLPCSWPTGRWVM